MRPIHALCLAALAAGCATSPPPAPVETTRTVAGTPEEVRARIETAATGLGLAVQPGPGPGLRLARSGAPAVWADCTTEVVRHHDDDRGQRIDFAAPQARFATVDIGLAASPGGTTVSVSPHFTASYRNIYRNTAFERDCTSSGVLEGSLLAAAG